MRIQGFQGEGVDRGGEKKHYVDNGKHGEIDNGETLEYSYPEGVDPGAAQDPIEYYKQTEETIPTGGLSNLSLRQPDPDLGAVSGKSEYTKASAGQRDFLKKGRLTGEILKKVEQQRVYQIEKIQQGQ